MTIIWDWNGTLLNDVLLCSDLVNELLTQHGYPEVGDVTAYKNVFCFPIETYYKNAGFDFEKHSFNMLAKKYMAQYIPRSKNCQLQPNAKNVISQIKKCGHSQVILSASPIDILKQQVEQYEIQNYFDILLGLNDIHAKSKIELGKAWIKSTNLNADNAIMVGDSVHDFEVANAIGVKSVLYSGGHQPYATLKATGAPVIDDLQQLILFLNKERSLL